MFHQLPKNEEEAKEFFKNYQKNVLDVNSAKIMDYAKNMAKAINTGLANLNTRLDLKKAEFQVCISSTHLDYLIINNVFFL